VGVKDILTPELYHFTNAGSRVKANLENQSMGWVQFSPNLLALTFWQHDRLTVAVRFRHFPSLSTSSGISRIQSEQ
jgi:hypothetical protein